MGRALIAVVVTGLTVSSGIAAYAAGTMVRDGKATLPLELAALVVLGAVLCVGASVLAAAIGMLYPKFEASRITSNRSAVRPSLVAFIAYTIALVGRPPGRRRPGTGRSRRTGLDWFGAAG